MADDGLNVNPQPEGGENTNPGSGPVQNGAGESPDLKAMIRESLAPLQEGLRGLAQQVAAFNEQGQPGSGPAGSSRVPDDDLGSRLLTDPENVLDNAVQEGIKKHIGAPMTNLLQDRKDEMVAARRTAIDSEFGEGTWDKHFKPEIDQSLGQWPIELQASRAHFDVIVGKIGFEKRGELGKLAADKATKDADRETTAPPGMLGGGHPRPRGEGEISAEAREWLGDYNRVTGEKLSPKEYAEMEATGDTEDDWIPRIEKERASKGGNA